MSQEREDRIIALSQAIGFDIKTLTKRVVNIGGQFLCDPNEYNGWGAQGYTDNSNSQDLGNVGTASMARLAGGLIFPFDVRILRFYAWHRNSNGGILPWGWVIARQRKLNNTTATASTNFMLDEAFNRGVGQQNLRNYGNTNTFLTDINSFVNDVIPAGEVITLAVGCPTALDTSYFIQIMAGFIEFERLDI